MKCAYCGHEGPPTLSGPYDRPDGSRSAFYVCVGCDAIVPGYYEAAAERQGETSATQAARGHRRVA